METPQSNVRKPNADVRPIQNQLSALAADMNSLTLDEMNKSPKKEIEPTHRVAQDDINNSSMYIKPTKLVASQEKFNERFRESYEFDKKYVQIIAQNNEVKGETIEMWCKPYPGLPATFWNVPIGKPVYVPRFVAEQIKRKFYHRLKMETKPVGNDQQGQYYGMLAVEHTTNRIDCQPCSPKKSLFFSEDDFKDYKPDPQKVVNG